MKQKSLLRSLLLLFALVVGVGSTWADNVTFTPSDFSAATEEETSAAKDGVSISVSKGTISAEIRIFKSQTITISSESDITKIEFTCTAQNTTKYGPGCFGAIEGYSYSGYIGTWEGSSNSVTLTASSNQVRATQIVVTINNASDNRTAVNMTAFTAGSTNLVKGSTTTTTVTNDQPGWTAAYTYASNNTDVATVNANGVITAEAKGSARITATLNVDPNDEYYKAGTTTSKYIDITVTNPTHTASFYVNGTKLDADVDVEEEESITFPADPSDMGELKFVGWTKTPIPAAQSSAPEDLAQSATMGNANVSFYAVFAEGSETTIWKKKTANTVTEAGVYALLTTDGHAFNGVIDNGHGQVTSTAFSFTDNEATTAPEGTCELTFTAVTGGYTWYNEDNGYLYAKAAASKNLSWHNSESSYWYLSGANWKYKGSNYDAFLRSYENGSFRTYASSSSGSELVFAKKETTGSYSGYTTSLPNENVSVPEKGYITFCSNKALDFTEINTINVYTAKVNDGKVVMTQIKKVPAETGVILMNASGLGSAVEVTNVPFLSEDADDVSDNELVGVLENTSLDYSVGGKFNYVLQQQDGDVEPHFYKAVSGMLRAKRAYLSTTYDVTSAGAPALSIDWGEGTTGINSVERGALSVEGCYTLDGRRVAQPTKGLYIVNGRKVIIK